MSIVDHLFDSVDKTTFHNGMSRLGSAVSVVTTVFGGRRFGFTASAVCSVSDTPATLLVCINRASSSFPAFANTRHFCVNTLLPGQEDCTLKHWATHNVAISDVKSTHDSLESTRNRFTIPWKAESEIFGALGNAGV